MSKVPSLSDSPGIAYLMAWYPATSHTFVRREIDAVRATGLRVESMSVHRTQQRELLSEADRLAAQTTHHLLDSGTWPIADAHLSLLRRRPTAYASGLRRALSSGVPEVRSRVWQTFYFAEAVRLVALMREARLRHVHVHFANNAADIARLAVAIGSQLDPAHPWSWSLSVHGPAEFWNVKAVDLAAKVRSAAFVACISDFCRSQLMALVEPEHWPKLHVVHMGVDVDRYPVQAQLRAQRTTDRTRVLFVGRLVPEKGVPLLVEAAERLAATRPVEFVVVGTGPLHDSLAATIERRGLRDVVRLVGAVGQDELPDWYAWADIFCLPSFSEGLPVVLMEAMLSELPVVTTAIAGIPELVTHDQTGMIVPPSRVDALVAAIGQLIDEPETRTRLGVTGRRVVCDQFDAAETGRQMSVLLAGASGGSSM